jgi:chromosome partitioning protein
MRRFRLGILMIVVAVASQKGGSGKTTLCGHLAVEAERAGAGPVALIDTDPQGSLSHWWNARAARTPQFAKVGAFELESALAHLARTGTRLAIIDTPPAISASIAQVIAHCDMVIVPTRPSPHDLRAVGATVDMAERSEKPLIFVVNGATQRARITGEAAVALSQHGMVAPVTIHHRVDFAASMVDGRTVGEAVPKSVSSKEISELWLYIQDRLARLTKDASLAPEIRPQHFSLAPLIGIDAADEVETFEANAAELVAVHAAPRHAPTPPTPGVIHQQWSQPVNGHRVETMNEVGIERRSGMERREESMNEGGIERRSGKDRREHPLGSALFTGPERRTGVFGRRPNDTYDTSGRK